MPHWSDMARYLASLSPFRRDGFLVAMASAAAIDPFFKKTYENPQWWYYEYASHWYLELVSNPFTGHHRVIKCLWMKICSEA